MRIEENVPLSTVTTFRTGGPARFLVSVDSREELEEAVAFAEAKNLPVIPLGEGSNMLPPDEGLSAVLVRFLPSAITEEKNTEGAVLKIEAGCIWDAAVSYAVSRGLWGLENLSAIPGTVGASVVQNIGAYGAAVETSVLTVEAYDLFEKKFKTFNNSECRFGYRTSIFKEETDRYLVTNVSFALGKHGTPNLTYRDLTVYFETHPIPPTLENVRNAVTEIRRGKFPSLAEFGTAGSFFLNPIFTPESVDTIRGKYPEMPVFPLPEGGVKIPLAWILDHVLHAKGRRVGGAFVWDKQPLVIAVTRDAKTKDVVTLVKTVMDDFFKETGIKITPEVRAFGEDKEAFK